jgi:hypothetical protein
VSDPFSSGWRSTLLVGIWKPLDAAQRGEAWLLLFVQSGGSGLRRQPGGFEGLSFGPHTLDPDDLASTEGKEHEVRVVALDPTYLALAMLDDTRHDGVANRLNVLCQR